MRILIHGINFSPELTGIGKYSGEMATWLAAAGHEVKVVTRHPITQSGALVTDSVVGVIERSRQQKG